MLRVTQTKQQQTNSFGLIPIMPAAPQHHSPQPHSAFIKVSELKASDFPIVRFSGRAVICEVVSIESDRVAVKKLSVTGNAYHFSLTIHSHLTADLQNRCELATADQVAAQRVKNAADKATAKKRRDAYRAKYLT